MDALATDYGVEIRDLWMLYPVHPHGRRSLKSDMVKLLSGGRGEAAALTENVVALRGINMSARPGEKIGLIGHNGAGKSSLLRVIAGVYEPAYGKVTIKGGVQALFDIGLGFEPEATGRENIFYRGLVMGMTPKEIEDSVSQIVEFSDLGQFVDLPFRTYSAGMKVRLAFSVSTFLKGEILLIDEVFGAGDANFQHRARERMMGLVQGARVVFFSSHDLGTVNQLCNRVIWLDGGRIIVDGDPKTVTDMYLSQF